jgi:murein DD-endopeptidase MepM/ murein hydrolase activator NlpD
VPENEVQIIVVDPRLKRAISLTLTSRTYWLVASLVAFVIVLSFTGLSVAALKAARDFKIPLVQEFAASVLRDQVERNEQFTRENVNAMALKLGEMQAQLMRLDALGERVSRLSGIRPEQFDFTRVPGRGGADTGGRPLTLEELKAQLDVVSVGVERRADYMDVIESDLITARARRALLPANTPVPEGFIGSGFGMRTDPITGRLSMHDGVDFAAPRGTPIFAAAGGVVATSEFNASFGNSVVIDHGDHLSTLYAHLNASFVKAGDIVRKGQKIGEVGNTGRSTGSHLHFEVHRDGVPQNPTRFLAANTEADQPLVADLKSGSPRARPASGKVR